MEILVFLLGILLGFTFGVVWVWATDKLSAKPIIKGYHFHHSMFTIPALFIALFTQEVITVILLGLGIGIIIQHTYREGFKFITKK